MGEDTAAASGREPTAGGLATSARASLSWSGGFTLLRDLVQFATMLVLVRLLSPEDYGTAAFAQAVVGLLSVASFGTFVLHALQLRNPDDIDWQAHFTAAAFMNSILFCVTCAAATVLWFTETYQGAAVPLAALGSVFLVEPFGTLRHRMLETAHDWKRFRLLLIIGTFLAAAAGLAVAALGGGVWALVIQPPLLGLPAVIDLFLFARWRPNWSWSWARYRDTARFGFNRLLSMSSLRGRVAIEQTVLASVYDFAALGIFTRSIGLATLVSGRVGSVAMASLHPVVTRAPERSERFQRIASLVLRGVCWTTIPPAVLLIACAEDAVALFYGSKWLAVAGLLPFATAAVALSGIAAALSGLLVAGGEAKICLWIDVGSAITSVGLALWLVRIGIGVYLGALALHAALVLVVTAASLIWKAGMTRAALIPAFVPPAIASGCAGLAVFALATWSGDGTAVPARFLAEAFVFGLVFLMVLRFVFARALKELLQVAPAGRLIARCLVVRDDRPHESRPTYQSSSA